MESLFSCICHGLFFVRNGKAEEKIEKISLDKPVTRTIQLLNFRIALLLKFCIPSRLKINVNLKTFK